MKSSTVYLCTTGTLAVLSLTGCGGSSSPSSTPTLTPRSVSTTLSNGLTATLTEDRSTVAVGGTVNYTATLTNNTAQPITFQYTVGPSSMKDSPDAAPARLVVTNPTGQDASPPPGAAQFGVTVPSFTLAPGKSLSASEAAITDTEFNYVTNSAVLHGYASAGQYTAAATFEVTPLPSTDTSQPIQATTGPLTVTAQ